VTGDLGLFGPGSLTWRVHEEPILALAGLRALFLQALHPRAIAGVVQNSGYKTDPWGRLVRTITYVATTIYGTTVRFNTFNRTNATGNASGGTYLGNLFGATGGACALGTYSYNVYAGNVSTCRGTGEIQFGLAFPFVSGSYGTSGDYHLTGGTTVIDDRVPASAGCPATDVDGQSHVHVREDDDVLQRYQQQGAQRPVSPDLGIPFHYQL
jgi:hypothetical protein